MYIERKIIKRMKRKKMRK